MENKVGAGNPCQRPSSFVFFGHLWRWLGCQTLIVLWTLAGGFLSVFPRVSDEATPDVPAHRLDRQPRESPAAFGAAPVRRAVIVEVRELGAMATV
jgi:hypothetical protein